MTVEEARAYFKKSAINIKGIMAEENEALKPRFSKTLEATEMAIKALEQEPCEDAISRQAVDELSKELVHATRDKADFLCNFWEGLQKLPPVTPQPKTGHWEWVQYDYNSNIGNWHCSECKNIAVVSVKKNEKGGIPIYKYCPNCGAKMVEPQESEDKE